MVILKCPECDSNLTFIRDLYRSHYYIGCYYKCLKCKDIYYYCVSCKELFLE